MRGNYVAKHSARLNKAKRHRLRHKYTRKNKHAVTDRDYHPLPS